MSEEWIRVTHRNPCPICHKPDWCCIGQKGVNCMRIESTHPVHNGGWFHPFDVKEINYVRHKAVPKTPVQRPAPDFAWLLSSWADSHSVEITKLAEQLGIESRALCELGAHYSQRHEAYAFPMYFPDGRISGIRLRNAEGKKWAIKGSKAGLFIPFDAVRRLTPKIVMICEGPTDTAAALTLGLFSIGRPACLGQEDMVAEVLKEIGTRDAYICYDNDSPGVRGAEKLSKKLRCRVTRFVPPAKDLRAFVQAGGTKELLLSMINNACSSL